MRRSVRTRSSFQFSGTTNSIKVVFAAKITTGGSAAAAESIDAKAAQTYYVPIFPCVTNFADVPSDRAARDKRCRGDLDHRFRPGLQRQEL